MPLVINEPEGASPSAGEANLNVPPALTVKAPLVVAALPAASTVVEPVLTVTASKLIKLDISAAFEVMV